MRPLHSLNKDYHTHHHHHHIDLHHHSPTPHHRLTSHAHNSATGAEFSLHHRRPTHSNLHHYHNHHNHHNRHHGHGLRYKKLKMTPLSLSQHTHTHTHTGMLNFTTNLRLRRGKRYLNCIDLVTRVESSILLKPVAIPTSMDKCTTVI